MRISDDGDDDVKTRDVCGVREGGFCLHIAYKFSAMRRALSSSSSSARAFIVVCIVFVCVCLCVWVHTHKSASATSGMCRTIKRSAHATHDVHSQKKTLADLLSCPSDFAQTISSADRVPMMGVSVEGAYN